MNILAIDTSSEILDIALRKEDEIHVLTKTAGLRHSELLLPGISYLLESADLGLEDIHLIVCAKGPGSFTGLRIGISTAKGICAGTGIPLVSVPTLDALAYPYRHIPLPVLPVIDAKKKRFYSRLFQKGNALSPAVDADLDDILNLCGDFPSVAVTGPHAGLFLERAQRPDVFVLGPGTGEGCSRSLCVLGEIQYKEKGADEDGEGPLYLRKSDAELERERKLNGQ
ncbi:MAG: tRNA (adenosine(37)-N6)-threonylcarbamoyltransferase complex dimerization subunit type 1 TsaB [Spirochaetales bacterium]|nr:tRNA (adenosine(37)-N6)-threonylcarbamoyltransferase complex dimerization subunit type 1 TsaB [Spirochaetales bacterium]